MDAWVFCSCGDLYTDHAEGGKCRATSLDGWPCECTQFDTDDEVE
ncbi:hypothetical protein [Streptacidiphilus cavernicola]|uniref:Uncharacterized protein n=1 Tax=Streptacidiphilus cavernicola TaxID=3342716 RepID=A0ABV6VYD9_9ACTN